MSALEFKVPAASARLNPAAAKVTDLETSFDAIPVPSVAGEVIWADVQIDYLLSGLMPSVTIRVPVPWSERDTPEERKAKALRSARQLIEHACRAAGVIEPEAEKNVVEGILEAVTPPALAGLSQELGLARPKSRP